MQQKYTKQVFADTIQNIELSLLALHIWINKLKIKTIFEYVSCNLNKKSWYLTFLQKVMTTLTVCKKY